MATAREIIEGFINDAATAFGVPAPFLHRVAQIESGYGQNPAAYDATGAQGLFQFMPGTARAFGLTNPLDDRANAWAAADLTRQNQLALTAALGRAPSERELYLAHQQGFSGAVALLTGDPLQSAIDDLAPLYGGNRTLATRAVTGNVGGTVLDTSAEFADRVMDYYSPDNTTAGYTTAAGDPISPAPMSPTGGTNTIGLDPALVAGASSVFMRGIIIILGFIFVAVGLSMFKPTTMVLKEVRK